jgi:hypothetical protein
LKVQLFSIEKIQFFKKKVFKKGVIPNLILSS